METKVPVPTALDDAWMVPCQLVVLDAPPRSNDELLQAVAEANAEALRDCDGRMAKIRDAQPEIEE